ncbi:MAG: hypothetical protein HYV97_01250 [Bdellovibrio sp.]|nr:hypothetical protein [Bdellovibrio sp.]
MKIHYLALWSFLQVLGTAWGGEFFHFFGPTKNLSFLHIHASPVTIRVQLTGALSPLNFFINGEDKTELLKTLPCDGKEPGFYVNQKHYLLVGAHLRFYAELIESGVTQLEIELIGRTKCFRTSLPLSNNIFQQKVDEKYEIEDEQYKSPYPFILTGALKENEIVEMNPGTLTRSEGRASFETLLNEGENHFSGISKNREGAEEILSYKLTLERESFSSDRPTLSLKKNGIDWSSEIVVLSQEIENIEGYMTPGWKLKINQQLVESNIEGYFQYFLEWGQAQQTLQFELIEPSGRIFHKTKKLQFVDWTPTSPWYNPGHLKDRSLVVGLSFGHFFLSQDSFTQAIVHKIQDFAPTLSIVYKYNRANFYAFKARHLERRRVEKGNRSFQTWSQYQLTLLKLWELPADLELGTGVSYRGGGSQATEYHHGTSAGDQSWEDDTSPTNGFDLSLLLDRRFRAYRDWFVATSLGLHVSTGIPEKHDNGFFEIIFIRFERLF